jgi:hypothetical protein
MSFFVTPQRRLRILRGCVSLVIAVVIGAMPWIYSGQVDQVFICIITGVCILAAIFNFWLAKRTPSNAVVTHNPQDLPTDKRIAYYTRMRWLTWAACPGLAIIAGWDLHQLEAGAKQVRAWVPIAYVYENFGYWPAVLTPIAIGLICDTVFANIIHAARKDAARDAQMEEQAKKEEAFR